MNNITKKDTDDKNITDEKTVRISIGFSQSDYKVIQEFAKEYNTSIANVARLAVQIGLDKYLILITNKTVDKNSLSKTIYASF